MAAPCGGPENLAQDTCEYLCIDFASVLILKVLKTLYFHKAAQVFIPSYLASLFGLIQNLPGSHGKHRLGLDPGTTEREQPPHRCWRCCRLSSAMAPR